jgi:hypothetical protein
MMFLEIKLPEEDRDERESLLQDDRSDPAESKAKSWNTEIELVFPMLGELFVTLSRNERGLNVRVAAAATSAEVLREGATGLLERLDALGFERPQLEINRLPEN